MDDEKDFSEAKVRGQRLQQAARELRAVYEADPELTAFSNLDAIEWENTMGIDTPPQTPYN